MSGGVRSGSGKLKLFIDGIELPVISAQVSFQDGAPASASVQMVATGPFMDIQVRSLVTLFYLDPGLAAAEVRGGASVRWIPVGAEDPRAWKTLFIGEVAARAISRNAAGNRVGQLQCVDLLSYLDSLRQLMGSYAPGTPDRYENAFLGVRGDRAARFATSQKSVESNLLNLLKASTLLVNGENMPSLYLGVHRLVREQFFAANLFYARAFNRHRMNDMIVGLPGDTTSAKLFKLSYFKQWINNQIGAGGGMLTARGLVDTLLNTVYHTLTTIPCPMLDRTGALRGFNPDRDDSELAREIIQRDAWAGAVLHQHAIKPDAQFLVPPVCNVFLPEHVADVSYQHNMLQEPTRLFMRLSTNSGYGLDQTSTERFYAPDFAALDPLLKVKGGVGDRMASVLLPHEEYVGINPIMSWQPGVGAYAAKGARREYLSQCADHDFWRARFGQRNLSINGPFNPSPVPGFSGIFFDRPVNARPDDRNRHCVGHVQAVSHTFQPDGAYTSVSMTAVRLYDEEIDYDRGGRSIEEVAGRGTDSFLDDRYDPARIGKEVYRPLLGCDAVTDVFNLAQLRTMTAALPQEEADRIQEATDQYGAVAGAVLCIEARYRSLEQQSGGDVGAFVQEMTRRPTADSLELLGLARNGTTDMEGLLGNDYKGAAEMAPGSDPWQGFLSVSVDVDCWDMKYDSYQLTKRATVPAGTRTVPAIALEFWDHTDGDGTVHYVTTEVTPAEVQQLTSTQTSLTEPRSYGLRAHLLARQEFLNRYRASIEERGIRG